MALTGLQYLVCAPLTETKTSVSYKDGMVMAHAIKADVSIDINEAKLYADNRVVESVKEFKAGKLKLNGDHLSYEVLALILGHKIEPAEDGGERLVANVNDVGKNVGVGFYATTLKDGVKKYRAIWFKKVLYGIPNDAMETKGETISFKTVEIEGTIMGDVKGDWKEEQIFATEAEAEKWLNEMAGIKEDEGEEENG